VLFHEDQFHDFQLPVSYHQFKDVDDHIDHEDEMHTDISELKLQFQLRYIIESIHQQWELPNLKLPQLISSRDFTLFHLWTQSFKVGIVLHDKANNVVLLFGLSQSSNMLLACSDMTKMIQTTHSTKSTRTY
jgi:hypothetical protein